MPKVIHYFIPHSSNNHRPFFTQHPGLATILIFALLIQSSINVFFSTNPTILGFATNIYKDELITLTNSERTNGGLAVLRHNSSLDEAARLKALHMFEYDYWAHVSPDGVEPWHWFSVVGYNYTAAGENLARDFDTSSGVVSAWMASPSHRENIMYPNFAEIGMAVVDGNLNGEDTTLVVQLFGTPTPAPNLVVEPVYNPTPTATIALPTSTPTPRIPTPTNAIPPTQIPVTPTPLPLPTATPTSEPTPVINPTNSPTPTFAFSYNSNTHITSSGTVLSNPPNQLATRLAVITNLKSFGASRIFSIVLIISLILLLSSESLILWMKGIKHPHAHRIVHVGILILTLLATLYGASGSIV